MPELILGNRYYVSFSNNNVYPCELIGVSNEFEETEVEVKFSLKPTARIRIIKIEKEMRNHVKIGHILYAKEIGSTPEQAVNNTVK